MQGLYPLKFRPIPREMIWGGHALKDMLNKDFPEGAKIGESWEISAYENKISVVANGMLKGNNLRELVEVYMGDLVGEKVFDRFGTEFPLLIKFIDARDVLSVQVHPDDELAMKHHGSWGKTEMWYVLDADADAELISGFKSAVTAEIFIEKLKSGNLLEILNIEKVKRGDVFFLPAGRVHAICKGIVLAEIQQTSDLTYRIYDWDRHDKSGNPRQLHVDLAVQAIDFGVYPDYKTIIEEKMNSPVLLVDCKYFTTQLISFDRNLVRDYSLTDSFIIYICTDGEMILNWAGGAMPVVKGETVLIPAMINEIEINCSKPAKLLEVYIK